MAIPSGRGQLSQMTTEQLELLLRQYIESPAEENADTVALILEILEERRQSAGQLPDVDAAWQDFNGQYRNSDKVIYPVDERGEHKNASGKGTRHLKTVLLAAVLVLTLLLLLTPSVWSDSDVYSALYQQTESIFEDSPDLEADFRTLFPNWLPDGYVITGSRYSRIFAEPFAELCLSFTAEQEDWVLHYTITIYEDPEKAGIFAADQISEPVDKYQHNGNTFYFMSSENDATSVAALYGENTVLSITSTGLSRADLERFIDSIDK